MSKSRASETKDERQKRLDESAEAKRRSDAFEADAMDAMVKESIKRHGA